MKIGLVGAQGVGKTTLAEAVSNETDLPLVFTNTVAVFESMGLRPDQVLPFETRMEVQHAILDSAIELWEEHFSFITDRTPLDMLAYTMVDINSDTRLTKEQTDIFKAYIARCISACNAHFNMTVLVQPGIPFRDLTKSRAALDPILCEKMNALMLGLVMREDLTVMASMIPRNVLNLKDRVRSVEMTMLRAAAVEAKGINEAIIH